MHAHYNKILLWADWNHYLRLSSGMESLKAVTLEAWYKVQPLARSSKYYALSLIVFVILNGLFFQLFHKICLMILGTNWKNASNIFLVEAAMDSPTEFRHVTFVVLNFIACKTVI